MGTVRSSLIATATSLLLGCGPGALELDDTYPRNCGEVGPVTLLELEPMTGLEIARTGDHYLVLLGLLTNGGVEVEHWAVDRCGETPVLLQPAAVQPSPTLGVAGEHLLSCDESTGEVSFVDPTGVGPPRELFPGGVEACRVIPVGQGLAAQQQQGSTVWFHPAPSDPGTHAVVVTETALFTDPDPWICGWMRLDCEVHDRYGFDIRAAGDDLLVPLEDESLLAFSSRSQASRILHPGPLRALDVLPEGERVVVALRLGPTLVVDRRTGSSFEFCCWGDWNPIRQLGDWLVHGADGPPIIPEPPEWTNFWAYHLPSGARTELVGTEEWNPFARFTTDTVLASIGPYPGGLDERVRTIVWPSTGEREPLPLPADARVWTLPDRDGAYALQGEAPPYVLHYLAEPNASPEILFDDVEQVLPTLDGTLLIQPHSPGGPTPLLVMRSNHEVVEVEPSIVAMLGDPVVVTPASPRPEDRDEVVYVTEEHGRWLLKRTVLP